MNAPLSVDKLLPDLDQTHLDLVLAHRAAEMQRSALHITRLRLQQTQVVAHAEVVGKLAQHTFIEGARIVELALRMEVHSQLHLVSGSERSVHRECPC